MTMRIMFAALAVIAGIAAAVQGAVNAELARATGLGQAVIINTIVVLIGAVGLWAALGAEATFFVPGTSWSVYLGGLCGFLIVASLAFVFPKLGAAYAVALMVGGQCIAALAIDHYGLIGMPLNPLTAQRMVGVGMVAAGVLIMRM